MNIKDEIARVSAEHDRLMAEAAEEQRSQAEDTLVFKTHENAQVTEPSSEGLVALFGDWRDEVLSEAIGEVVAHERQREREERGEAIAPLKREIAERMAENARLREEVTELRGQVSALLAMFGGGKAKGAEIIDLIPNWRKPDAA